MTLLRVDASIQGDRSASSLLADRVLAEFTSSRPDAEVVSRHLGREPLPADAWPHALAAGSIPAEDRSPEQRTAFELAAQAAGELRNAQAAILAMPLYNWGVSQHAKTWIDLAIAGSPPGEALLEGKPVALIVTRGGAYGPGTPKEGWDHAIDYLRRIIADVWQADLNVIERELTLAGVNPALDELIGLADELRTKADARATEVGNTIALRYAS